MGDSFYGDAHHNNVGFYFDEAVYAPLYYGYGGPGEYADRTWYARHIEADIMHKAPDTVLVHVKASADVIRKRLKENPHKFSLLQDKDIETVLTGFAHHYEVSFLRHKFEIDTSTSSIGESICEFGKKNNFETIISLQPIAGFGNKVLTNQELKYVQTGEDYTNNLLIESSSIYQNYAKNLSEITACTKTFDIRNVFDTETGPIYWDQGHVSDKGNSIIAKSLSSTVFSIISKNHGFSTFETEKDIKKTSSSFYDDREIVVTVELLPSNESNNKKVKISTYDNINKEDVQNVTYFLAISKNNENLLREYFFAKDGILTFDVFPKDSNQVQVLGEQQYDHNAYVMSDVTPLQVKGPIFSKDGIYAFDIELRTIDDPKNWIFSLSGFHSKINIEKETTFGETFTDNKSSFQTENLLRKIFSYYKTPILLNEIFK
mgnify:CR=1 FL=1